MKGKEREDQKALLVRRFRQYGQCAPLSLSLYPSLSLLLGLFVCLSFSRFYPFRSLTRVARVFLYGVIRMEKQILDRGIHEARCLNFLSDHLVLFGGRSGSHARLATVLRPFANLSWRLVEFLKTSSTPNFAVTIVSL